MIPQTHFKHFQSALIFIVLSAYTLTAFAQTTNNRFVFLKNPAGILTGVIIHDGSFLSNIKINAFCAGQYFTTGTTCEKLADGSPYAADPNQALRFVNRNPTSLRNSSHNSNRAWLTLPTASKA